MKLADFIESERARILQEWEAFARTQTPAANGMDARGLRDHADEILTAIIEDMGSHQTRGEEVAKSKGNGRGQYLEEVGRLHAELRIESGFKLNQMVAEYRALRGSVLRLWRGDDPAGVTRFNEAIDEALTEAVQSFAATTEHFRDQSLGILGHDLRNPLSAIVTGAVLLTEDDRLNEENVQIASRILNSANRMSRMINDLLDLTRTRFGQLIPVSPALIDLAPLCREVIAEFESQRAPSDLRFSAEGNLAGDWDSDRVSQLLSNLVANAIQHGGKGPIDVVAKDAGDQVLLQVHNGGNPIPPNALHTIFDPMVRHTENFASKGGLGLGLYIASQIVLAHGGTINASSTEAEGTTMTVHLPRRIPANR